MLYWIVVPLAQNNSTVVVAAAAAAAEGQIDQVDSQYPFSRGPIRLVRSLTRRTVTKVAMCPIYECKVS